MEKNEISLHEVRVYAVLEAAKQLWVSNSDIQKAVGNISPRTVQAHTLKLVRLGVIDQADVFPGHRFRWSDKGSKRNAAYVNRLKAAFEVFQIGD